MASLGILFPNEAIGELSHLRGAEWQDLVKHVFRLPADDPDALAFGLLMVQICDCLKCDLHVYRLRRGCARCALAAVREAKDSDKALMRRFQKARAEIDEYLKEVA
jgi:hypothetical protein